MPKQKYSGQRPNLKDFPPPEEYLNALSQIGIPHRPECGSIPGFFKAVDRGLLAIPSLFSTTIADWSQKMSFGGFDDKTGHPKVYGMTLVIQWANRIRVSAEPIGGIETTVIYNPDTQEIVKVIHRGYIEWLFSGRANSGRARPSLEDWTHFIAYAVDQVKNHQPIEIYWWDDGEWKE